ncbi:hypothetical protein SDC9_153160 [bioreactor metagenome]|uniref:Uncharacterized protein n=1 Tax=bioreactor metagenome TaxID=1076179 RepID=A0A645EWU2_9ZZZZ
MPKNAAAHIQKSAPGPPVVSAADTPTILPVPMVAESEVQSARKGAIAAPSLSETEPEDPKVSLSPHANPRI